MKEKIRVVRCPICGKWAKDPKDQPDGSWEAECADCGTVTGWERGRDR